MTEFFFMMITNSVEHALLRSIHMISILRYHLSLATQILASVKSKCIRYETL